MDEGQDGRQEPVGVARLVTTVELQDPVGVRADRRATDQVSVSARHDLELADGTRVVLLDDRGWGSSATWAATSAQDVAATARVVVGPDEPFGAHSPQDMAADHWAFLQQVAQRQGVVVAAAQLRQLPHDVVLSPRVRDLLAGG